MAEKIAFLLIRILDNKNLYLNYVLTLNVCVKCTLSEVHFQYIKTLH